MASAVEEHQAERHSEQDREAILISGKSSSHAIAHQLRLPTHTYATAFAGRVNS